MFEGLKKKISAQPKTMRQKPILGIMSRSGGVSSQPAVGSGGDPAKSADEPVRHDRTEEMITIGAAATICGDITGKSDLAISGRVEGTVNLPGNDANIEASGFMDGSILAKNVNIRGKVRGDIEAKNKVTIFSAGTVVGMIVAPRLHIKDGAKFKGRIDMGVSKPAAAPKLKKPPAPAPTAPLG